MLAQKWTSQALWPSIWLSKAPSPSKELTPSQFRISRTPSKLSFEFKAPLKRSYLTASAKSSRNVARGTKSSGMLTAASAAAAVVIGGSAAYSTATDAQQSQDRPTLSSSNVPAFESAAFQIPHPEKKYKGGEDTLFVSSNGLVLGVFDGMFSSLRPLPSNFAPDYANLGPRRPNLPSIRFRFHAPRSRSQSHPNLVYPLC
jgi:hypothetical protein